jgi:hypothetical protein
MPAITKRYRRGYTIPEQQQQLCFSCTPSGLTANITKADLTAVIQQLRMQALTKAAQQLPLPSHFRLLSRFRKERLTSA